MSEQRTFREKPEIDVEFIDSKGNPVAQTIGLLTISIDDDGILLNCLTEFSVTTPTEIGGYNIWIGNKQYYAIIDAIYIPIYQIYKFPISIRLEVIDEIKHNA